MTFRYGLDVVTQHLEDRLASALDEIASVHRGIVVIDNSYALATTPRDHRKYFNLVDCEHLLEEKVRLLTSQFPGAHFALTQSIMGLYG
jgi:hypothetical protein